MTLTRLNKAPFPWAGIVEIRDDGTVWRITSHGKPCEPRRIDRPDYSKGYRNVALPDPGRGQWCSFKAHRLVWWWHHGPIPDGMQVDHINGDKQDNRLANLRVVDQSTNMLASYQNGRTRPWSRSTEWRGKPIVTHETRVEMCDMRVDGALLREIAARFGLSTTHVHRIVAAEGRSGE